MLLRGILAIGMRFGPTARSTSPTGSPAGTRRTRAGSGSSTRRRPRQRARKEVLSQLRADFRVAAGCADLERCCGTPTCGSGRRRSSSWSAAATCSRSWRGARRVGRAGGFTRSGASRSWRAPASPARVAPRAVPRRPRCRSPGAGGQDDRRRARTRRGDKLVPLLKDSAPRAQFFAAEALGRIAYKPASARIVAMLAGQRRPRRLPPHAGSLALARSATRRARGARAAPVARGAARRRRRAAPHAQRRRRALPRRHGRTGRRRGGARDQRRWRDRRRAAGAGRDAWDEGDSRASRCFAAPSAPTSGVGTTERRRASRPSPPTLEPGGDARVEAVSALGVWAAPSPLDRVDGFHLGSAMQQPRDDPPPRGPPCSA